MFDAEGRIEHEPLRNFLIRCLRSGFNYSPLSTLDFTIISVDFFLVNILHCLNGP